MAMDDNLEICMIEKGLNIRRFVELVAGDSDDVDVCAIIAKEAQLDDTAVRDDGDGL